MRSLPNGLPLSRRRPLGALHNTSTKKATILRAGGGRLQRHVGWHGLKETDVPCAFVRSVRS